MSTPCEHEWEELHGGLQCSQCGAKRIPPPPPPKGGGMFCPLKNGIERACDKEYCGWWSAEVNRCVAHRRADGIQTLYRILDEIKASR